MKNALVTGGAGFIGSALIRGLLDEPGIGRVAALDNFLTGHAHNLDEVRDRIEFYEEDIRNRERLTEIFQGFDTVFHEAAIPSVPRSIKEPDLSHDVNVNGTFAVLRAAVDAGVKRVVYAASSSAYGDTETLPKTESMLPIPKSPYAVQKLLGEYYLKTFSDNYGLETVAIRYFNVFGPRQDPASPYSGVLSIFSTCALEKRAPTIFGDGEQSRDFTYVDNVVRINILAAKAEAQQVSGNVYNGGIGGRITLNETWNLVQKIEGLEVPASYGPSREGDVRDSQADLIAVQRDLGYEPVVSFEEGLRRTLAWYRESTVTA